MNKFSKAFKRYDSLSTNSTRDSPLAKISQIGSPKNLTTFGVYYTDMTPQTNRS